MSAESVQSHYSGLSRLKLFLALSRTPHGLLDMATPALAALLWLGTFPPLEIVILGLITAFAGYTAVYALNDVIDYRLDKENLRLSGFQGAGSYLDALLVRHPIAQGLLSLREGLLWALAWAILALVGAYTLNPVCVFVFLAGCALEAVYCLLLRVSHLRTIVSGAVKTSGGLASVFAVDPDPSLSFLIILFLWLFFWEIGGQNVPLDWIHIEEDKRLRARTIPVRLGREWTNVVILGSLLLAIAISVVLFHLSPVPFEPPFVAASLLAGLYLLLLPVYRLYRTRESVHRLVLFNRASYYPLALFTVVMIRILI